MSNPEWEEGPKDATHWCAESELFLESWYKLEGDSWFCITVDSWRDFKPNWFGIGRYEPRTGETLIERPESA